MGVADYGPMAFEEAVLDAMKVGIVEHLSARDIALQRPELNVRLERLTDSLAFHLTAYLLTENAGPVVVDGPVVDLPVKPRWMPAFVWRRIPTHRARFTISVQPKYSYPSANIKVPDIGRPVRFHVMERGF